MIIYKDEWDKLEEIVNEFEKVSSGRYDNVCKKVCRLYRQKSLSGSVLREIVGRLSYSGRYLDDFSTFGKIVKLLLPDNDESSEDSCYISTVYYNNVSELAASIKEIEHSNKMYSGMVWCSCLIGILRIIVNYWNHRDYRMVINPYEVYSDVSKERKTNDF